jgi:hypothetical protein
VVGQNRGEQVSVGQQLFCRQTSGLKKCLEGIVGRGKNRQLSVGIAQGGHESSRIGGGDEDRKVFIGRCDLSDGKLNWIVVARVVVARVVVARVVVSRVVFAPVIVSRILFAPVNI